MGAVQILVPSKEREKALDALRRYRSDDTPKPLQPKNASRPTK
jgi:hypothetical protein